MDTFPDHGHRGARQFDRRVQADPASGRFFFYDLLGEAIWIFGYGGLGYLFGTQWEVVSDVLSNISGLSLGLVISRHRHLAGGQVAEDNRGKKSKPSLSELREVLVHFPLAFNSIGNRLA
ncbi:MAG: hypothetical protein MZV64_17405 [Ignavibacteriales bacterium]|nr:hypothetical protein [Ignavibacteriales bacterium]